MPTTITVKEVVQPAPGKKQGAIIDTQNRRWQVWANDLGNYQTNNQYEILATKESQFNGRTYVTITDSKHLGRSAMQAQAPQASMPASDDVRRMDIFVCGAINSMLGNANVDPFSIEPSKMILAVERYKEIWRQTLGPSAGRSARPVPQQNDVTDDEIPF